MNTVLWVLQGVAAVFAGSGLAKIALPQERLSKIMGDFLDQVPVPAIKLLGVAEVAAAVGLIAPPLSGIAPILTPLAAIGVIAIMVGGIVIHGRRREFSNVAVNVVLAISAGVRPVHVPTTTSAQVRTLSGRKFVPG